MEFCSLTFIVTEDCNFNCTYCYKKKNKIYITDSIIEKSIDFFSPYLNKECYINFYGGEPLLAFDKIKKIIYILESKKKKLKKNIYYSITSNGSLINNKILQFLNQYKFSVLLSFDGYAQEISRKKGSFTQTVSIIKNSLTYPDIKLEINSVFTQKTVGTISKSISFILGLGIPKINLSINTTKAWNKTSIQKLKKELRNLSDYLYSYYQKTGSIPLNNFIDDFEKGIFQCAAGKDRMALTPHGNIWGCYLFADYFQDKEKNSEYLKYYFGNLDFFIKNHKTVYPKILSNYSKLRADYFWTSEKLCMLCDNIEECRICPMDAAFSGSIIGKVTQWTCQINKILLKEKKLLWQRIKS